MHCEAAAAKRTVSIPSYTVGEEIFNAVSHGLGALLSVAALAIMLVQAQGARAIMSCAIFGTTMVLLYTVSCVYHALSPSLAGKRVLRVIDHCNVFLMVLGSYLPASLLGVRGRLGLGMLIVVGCCTLTGIVLTAIDLERFQRINVLCHLISGWSILFGVSSLLRTMGARGVGYLILGGAMYSVGSVLYRIGAKKRYRHSVFHVFCMLGTFCHFWAIYRYLL